MAGDDVHTHRLSRAESTRMRALAAAFGYVVEHVLYRHTLRVKQAELLFGSTEE